MIEIKAERNKETDGMNVVIDCDCSNIQQLVDIYMELAAGVGSFLHALAKQIDKPFEDVYDEGVAAIASAKNYIDKNAESHRKEHHDK